MLGALKGDSIVLLEDFNDHVGVTEQNIEGFRF